MEVQRPIFSEPLVTILGNPIFYKNEVIHIKTKPVELRIKRQKVVISFNILLLGKDKAVLEIFWLKEYNLKINWIIDKVSIKNTQRQ